MCGCLFRALTECYKLSAVKSLVQTPQCALGGLAPRFFTMKFSILFTVVLLVLSSPAMAGLKRIDTNLNDADKGQHYEDVQRRKALRADLRAQRQVRTSDTAQGSGATGSSGSQRQLSPQDRAILRAQLRTQRERLLQSQP